jgi:hypothetical protein
VLKNLAWFCRNRPVFRDIRQGFINKHDGKDGMQPAAPDIVEVAVMVPGAWLLAAYITAK